MNLLYLAGAPGAGKTTTMTALTAWCDRVQADEPIPHVRLVDPTTATMVGVELGRDRDQFGGTDALPMSVSPMACLWMRSCGPDLVLAEGDRLAHMGFLQAAVAGGYRVTLALLEVPPDVLDARCEARGSTQNEPWRRGRATKAVRLGEAATAAGLLVVHLDGTAPVWATVRTLRAVVPALQALPDRGEVDACPP